MTEILNILSTAAFWKDVLIFVSIALSIFNMWRTFTAEETIQELKDSLKLLEESLIQKNIDIKSLNFDLFKIKQHLYELQTGFDTLNKTLKEKENNND